MHEHLIETVLGEQVHYEKPENAGSYRVYTRVNADSEFLLTGGYDNDVIDSSVAVSSDITAIFTGLFTASGFTLSADDLDSLRSKVSRRGIHIYAYDSDHCAIRADIIQVRVGGNNIAEMIVREEEYLEDLIVMRKEATTTNGLRQLQLPDGRGETYASPAALDAQIQAVRDRIAMYQAYLKGAKFVGTVFE